MSEDATVTPARNNRVPHEAPGVGGGLLGGEMHRKQGRLGLQAAATIYESMKV